MSTSTSTVLQLSRESKREELCQTVGSVLKRASAKMIHMETYFLIKLWFNHMTRQAVSDREQNVRWWSLLQVSAWHVCSYIAGIPLLAHGLTVKLSPCMCSHSSPTGRITACQHVWSTTCGHLKHNLLPAQACPRMTQHLSSKITH